MAATRRSRTVEPEFDPVANVLANQEINTAEELETLLDDLGSSVAPNSQIKVYKSTERGGKWAYIKTLEPPLQTDGLLDDLRTEWGGGEYYFRVYANGKAAATRRANIAGDPNPPKRADSDGGLKEFLPMIISTQQASADKTMQLMSMMMQQAQQSSDRQMQMMMSSSTQTLQMMMALIPAITGGKTDPLQLVAAIMSAKGDDKGTGLLETITALGAVKELFSNGGDGGGEESFLTTAIKTLGPTLATAVQSQLEARPPAAPTEPPRLSAPYYAAPPQAYQHNPANPIPQPAPEVRTVTAAPVSAGGPAAPGFMSDPVLSVIGHDVLFFARRGYPVDLAAEVLLERLDAAGVPEHAVFGLVGRFTSSPNWVADLAEQGLDLREHAPWAERLISELVRQYSEGHGEAEPAAGGGGSTGDARQDENFEP